MEKNSTITNKWNSIIPLLNIFEGLSNEQKELLLYRKICETGPVVDHFNGNNIVTEYPELSPLDYSLLISAAGLGDVFSKNVKEAHKMELMERNLYKNSLQHFHNILITYKQLAGDLNINNPLDLSHFFTYLLWNGYFSVSGEHDYSLNLKDRLLLHGINSFDVCKGHGVCMAYAEFLHNYLDVCGKKSAYTLCYTKIKKKDFDYLPDIDRKVEIKPLDLALQLLLSISALKTKLHINHAVTLVEDGNELFIYDPTNLCAFNIKDASKASLVNGEGEIELNSLLTFLIGSNPDPHYLFNKLLEGDFTSNLSSDKFVTSWEQALKLFSENKKLLNDAYCTVHSDLEFIDKQTDEIGGSIKIYINNSLKK